MPSLHHRDGDTGSIIYTAETEVIQVLFRSKDCKPGENPQHGDIVSSVYVDNLVLLSNWRGSIVVRAHASHAEGIRFESDSIP